MHSTIGHSNCDPIFVPGQLTSRGTASL